MFALPAIKKDLDAVGEALLAKLIKERDDENNDFPNVRAVKKKRVATLTK